MYFSGNSDEEGDWWGYGQDVLYYLYYGDQPKVSASALACDESVIQWHLHLGHASLKFIKLLFLSIKACL